MSDEELGSKLKLEEISFNIAIERKQEGNTLFRLEKWEEAMVAYRSALGCLPKRTINTPGPAESMSDSDEVEGHDNGETSNDIKDKAKEAVGNVVEIATPSIGQSERETRKLRATLNANIGACYQKLGNHKDAVESCTQALLDDPDYVKALERRATCNDILNTWSSLASAKEDYEKLLTLVSSSFQLADIRRKLQGLKPRLEIAQKRETDEMLSKLKGLGNSVLGNFGLSTDNFKFVPNGQGGYSVNFTR